MPVSKKPRKAKFKIKQVVKTVKVELPKQVRGSHVIVLPKNEKAFLDNHPNGKEKGLLVERSYDKKVYSQTASRHNPANDLEDSYERRMTTLREAKYVGIMKPLNEGMYKNPVLNRK